MRSDFSLPELTKEVEWNLSFYVKLNTVTVPKEAAEKIQLSFSTWDDEYGMCLLIHEDDEAIEYAY